MPKLYLVRHGEPSVVGVILGRTDPPLSERGREQCRSLRIPDVRFVYCSPLRRTLESAGIIASALADARVIVRKELIEIAMGEWDGRTWADIEAAFPELAKAKLADWRGVMPPGGEPWVAFEDRVDRALDEIAAERRSAAVVGHLAVNACIASRLLGDDPTGFRQDYGEVIELDL